MGFHPLDMVRNAFTDMRQHPFQTAMRFAARGAGPVAGAIADRGFNYYNAHHELPTQSNANGMTAFQGDQAGQQAMDRPLNGALGGMPEGHGQNDALANALMGNSGQGHGGNTTGWNMSQNYAGSHPTGGLLDFLGPGQNTTPNGSFFTDAKYAPGQGGGKHKDNANNGPGMQFGTGVSNFMVGGSPVITGTNGRWDPNGGVVKRRTFGY